MSTTSDLSFSPLSENSQPTVSVLSSAQTVSKGEDAADIRSGNDANVYKAGTVLIRGMFRRVWRPRYLEIHRDGTVRYYEPFSESNKNSNRRPETNLDLKQKFSISGMQHAEVSLNEIKSASSLSIPLYPPDVNDSFLLNQHHQHHLLKDKHMLNATKEQQSDQNIHISTSSPDSWDVLTSPGLLKERAQTGKTIKASSNSTTKNQNLRLKATMVVHDARAIDATHRDAHIGLPRNVFGFLFHSNSISIPQINSNHSLEYEINEGENQQPTSQSIKNKKKKQSFPSLPEICIDAVKNLQLNNSSHSRDYMCAVNTEEEAREWLSALQWAASKLGNDVLFSQSQSSDGTLSGQQKQGLQENDGDDNRLLEDYCIPKEWNSFQGINEKTPLHPSIMSSSLSLSSKRDEANHIRHRKSTISYTKQSQSKIEIPSDNSTIASGISRVKSIESIRTKPNRHNLRTKIKPKNEGRVVVTKVRKFHIHMIPYFQMVYEIRMILIENRKKKNSCPELSERKKVEERSFYHSHEDFVSLVKKMRQECNNNYSAQNASFKSNSDRRNIHLKKAIAATASRSTTLTILQKAEIDMKKYMNSWNNVKDDAAFDRIVSEELLLQNIDTLDKVLRLLTSDATACNSKAMREFLFLKTSNSDKQMQQTLTNQIKMRMVCKKFIDFEANESTDDFVKKWLWQDSSDTISLQMWVKYFFILLLLRYKRLICILVIFLGLLFGVEVNYGDRILQTNISMRIDMLVAVMITAFSLGREVSRLNMKAHFHLSTTSETTRNAFRMYIKNSSLKEKFSLLLERNGLIHRSKADNDPTESTAEDKDHKEDGVDDDDDDDDDDESGSSTELPSPLPLWPNNGGISCWSEPRYDVFKIRGKTYLQDKVKVKASQSMFQCLGVDLWLSDKPMKNIARHPSVLGGKLQEHNDTLVINFLLPFGNFVGYFAIPSTHTLPKHVARVWTQFRNGSKEYRDARLKLLPVVIDGPWIVRKAVGPGSAPAVLGKVIPLLYYTDEKIFEVDVNITSSRIAKAILNVVKGHTNALTIAFAFIIEAINESELPECVLCSFQIHEINVERCPKLPTYHLK